ncbi:MFS transporter [Streptomyces albidoflavus]|uniref:MFS transporter n=1 Tax=Streptomyces albidoflavus TaxID=1886 RepID=UPI001021A3CD|nr:MFS transporter [Streptomyces albidoflavus]RZD68250.1 MFS transporter [Streptomyces albidoflavus]
MTKRYAVRWFLAGGALARTGDELAGPALLLAGFAVAGSPATGALLLAALTVPAVLGGPLVGVLLDRARRPGRLLAAALLLYALGLGSAVAVAGRAPTAVTLACAVAAGLFAPALAGGWSAQLPRVAAPGGLPAATARDAATFHLASLAGPALAASLAAGTLPWAPAALAVALLLLAAPLAWRLPGSRPGRACVGAPAARSGVAALRAGLRLTARNPALRGATVTSVLSCAAQGMLTACAVPLGERVLGGAARGVALLAVVAGAALLANAVLARYPLRATPDALLRWTAFLQGAALLLAAACHPVLVLAAALLAGAGEGPQLTALFAVRHREAPARSRAQLFTTGASLKTTGYAAGAALAGQLADAALPAALLAAAALHLLAGAVPGERERGRGRVCRPRRGGGRLPDAPGRG